MTTTIATPSWTQRRATEADAADILDMFTESDFLYGTYRPSTLPEHQIIELVGDDTRLLLADGRVAGVYRLEVEGSDHGCHYVLHLRLRAAAPLSWWASAYQEILRAARWRKEIVRLAMRIPEFDTRGLQAARALGLTEEGTLADVVVHNGQRYGTVYFAQIWTPES
jgi:hypothetical protein